MYDIEKNIKEQKKYSNSLYYGQWETDKVIESYFDINIKGACIEVGAANGIRGSNTKYFEDNKWDVLCIEPNLEHKESLESSRNLVRYFACGNQNKDEYLHVFRVGEKNIASSLTSLIPDKRLVKDHKHLINDNYKVQVPVRTLDWILKNKVTNTPFESITKIDFISIDTEGTELDVIKGFDINNYDVKLFIIENNYNDKNIEEYMNEIGYIKDKRYKINDFYIKKPIKNKKMNDKLFSLGDLYVSDFIRDNNTPRGGKEPLTLLMDTNIKAPRLDTVTDPDKMYGQYWYRSGINATMTNELKSIAEELPTLIPIKDGDVFLDIACNDGTLFKFVPNNMVKIGVDPVDDSYYNESSQLSDLIIQDYFSSKAYKSSKYGNKKAKLITIIAMFYDLDNPIEFMKDIEDVMDDEGLLVMQMSYTPLMLKQLAFDNICHEHIYYHSLSSIINILKQVDMKVVDCKLNDINGGSFRIYIRKNKSNTTNFKTAPYRDVAKYRIDSILNLEKELKITSPTPYIEFYKQICNLRDETVNFIRKVKSQGKTVWGYGASTKGNTLLQWFGLDNTLIDGIAERSPYKFNLKTVGTNIPIYSEEEMRKANPDYMLVLPWHFISEFCKREKEYLDKGGKFIVPCPKFQIIEKQ